MKAERRAFLSQGLGAAALLALPRIVTAQPVAAGRPRAGRVRDVASYVLPWNCLFVRVRTEDGLTGWGECSPMSIPASRAFVEQELARLVVGADPFDAEPLWDRMLYDQYKAGPGGALAAAMAGIDIALWDLKAKALGLPLAKLLGGVYRDRVRVYGSVARGEGERAKSAAELARLAAAFAEQGFTAVKIRMQFRRRNVDPRPDPTFDVAREVRAAVGEKVDLMIDANNGYSVARAIATGRRLYEEWGVSVFEEPVAQHDYVGLASVVEALEIAVAAGEHEYNRWQFRDLITQGNADILNPDVIKVGGLTEAKKIAALAQAWEKPIVVHNTHPSLGTAASLHFVASLANGSHAQEYTGPREHENRVFKAPLRYADGHLALPTEPGLGLEVDEAELRRAIESSPQ